MVVDGSYRNIPNDPVGTPVAREAGWGNSHNYGLTTQLYPEALK